MRRRLAGLVGVAIVMAFVGAMLGTYQKVFTESTAVTVMSDRSGLLLDKGADVRLYGVPVGRVESVAVVPGGAAIKVALSPDEARRVPTSTTASIQASTVFGSKYVSLDVPKDGGPRGLTGGAVIQASGVTIEVNNVFEDALGLIDSIDPAKLNSTLTSMAEALDGRGAKLGRVIEGSNTYLETFNQYLPELREDLRRAHEVVETYADVAPALIDTAFQAGTTSATIREKEPVLEATFRQFTSSSRVIENFVDTLEEPLEGALREMRPVTGLLEAYAPAITCSIEYLDATQAALTEIASKEVPGIQMFTGFLPAQEPYKPVKNLPKFVTGVGPVCQPLPTAENPKPPHINFKDGTEGTYDLDRGVEPRTPIQIYEEGFADFFGQAGLQILLDDLGKGGAR